MSLRPIVFASAIFFAAAPARAQLAEHCNNDVDDDGDGLADCGDPDCTGHSSCSRATENTPRACQNGADDDADGLADCGDPGCGQLVFCVGRQAPEPEREEPQSIYAPRVIEPEPEHSVLAHEDPRRYPQAHVLAPLTFLSGMLAPAIGFSFRDDTAIDDTIAHLALGVTYAILDFWEISAVPVPIRLGPQARYEDPAFSTTLRFVDHEIAEVGVYANVAIPVTDIAGTPEFLPLENLAARSRDSSVAQLDLALLLRLHIGEIARIDLAAPAVVLVFSPEVRADLTFPLRIAFQITPYAYAAIFSGAIVPGPSYDEPKIPLGLAIGTTIPGSRRGPILDASLRFGWPRFWDLARPGDEVRGDAWQVTIDARAMMYLLP